MKISKIRKRKNIRKSKKSINDQQGGTTYKYYKWYIADCMNRKFAEWHCQKRREDEEAWGNNGDPEYEYKRCMYINKHNCKENYIKKFGKPPSYISQFWN